MEGVDHQHDPQNGWDEGEKKKGNKDGGLGADGGDHQRSFSHPVYHEKGTQYQGQEGEIARAKRSRKRQTPWGGWSERGPLQMPVRFYVPGDTATDG